MRSHARQNDRRGRGIREQEDEYYGSVHGDGHNRESYGHPRESYHREDTYRASTTAHRPSYDTSVEHPASRSHRDSWRTRDQEDIYSRHDGYQHQVARDDHAYLERDREPEHWPTGRPEMDTRYAHSHSDWYDQPYPSTSYAEPSSHHRHPVPHENPASSYSSWPPEASYTDDRLPLVNDDRQPERTSPARRRDFQRGKGQKQNKKFHSDSGWDKNRKRKGWDDTSDAKTDNPRELVERKWEPAPSWKASNPHNEDRFQSFQRSNNDRYNQMRTFKRTSNNQKQRRDWRQEDDSLNNWTRRSHHSDTSSRQINSPDKAVKTPSRRKHQASLSPTRSHSPAVSYQSRRSSRDRSRTRSVSPQAKRRRRDHSPHEHPRSQTPSEKGYFSRPDVLPARYEPEHNHSSGRSPARRQEQSGDWYRGSPVSYGGRSPEDLRSNPWNANDTTPNSWPPEPVIPDRGRSLSPEQSPPFGSVPRRRSVSSVSSRSSARSMSRSPSGHNKTVHRLPSSDPNGPAPPATLFKAEATGTSGKKKKKKNRANGQNNNHKNARLMRELYPDPTMPPPSTIPAPHSTHARDPSGDTYMVYSGGPLASTSSVLPHQIQTPERVEDNEQALPPRFLPIRSAGFKPITQASSSIKKFFPGDDDEATPEPPQPSSVPTFVPANHPSQANQIEPHKPLMTPEVHVPKVIYERPTPTIPPAAPTVPASEPMETTQSQLDLHGVQDHPPRSSSPPMHVSAAQSDAEANVDGPQTATTRDDFYKIVSQVGEGTFGKVYKAENTATKAFVALKRIRMESERDGFPVTAMREIKLLQSLRHCNVVQLYEMMISNGMIYMVFEYMDHDLTGILSQTQFSFTGAHLKSLCHQMLSGLAYLHQKGVIHRDIKGSNILINNKGELKLGDFGLARFYQKRRRSDYTNRVITLWYRPPELLLGATIYGPEVDMWSAGCIMLELFTKKPVFQGLDEIHQLDVIYKILGTPDPQRWAGMIELPWYELIKPRETIPNSFRELFRKWMSPAALDLAEQLLSYDPTLRVTALQAMTAPYFTQEEPPASPPSGLATLEGEWHELETKRERAKKRRKPEAAAQ